jgi:hypothetical protein
MIFRLGAARTNDKYVATRSLDVSDRSVMSYFYYMSGDSACASLEIEIFDVLILWKMRSVQLWEACGKMFF